MGVASYLAEGEVWEGGQSAGVDGCAQRGESWREQGCVDVGNTVGDGVDQQNGIGRMSWVNNMWWGGVGDCRDRGVLMSGSREAVCFKTV